MIHCWLRLLDRNGDRVCDILLFLDQPSEMTEGTIAGHCCTLFRANTHVEQIEVYHSEPGTHIQPTDVHHRTPGQRTNFIAVNSQETVLTLTENGATEEVIETTTLRHAAEVVPQGIER